MAQTKDASSRRLIGGKQYIVAGRNKTKANARVLTNYYRKHGFSSVRTVKMAQGYNVYVRK